MTCTMPEARLIWPSRLHPPERPDPPKTGKTVYPVTSAASIASVSRFCNHRFDGDFYAFGVMGLHGLASCRELGHRKVQRDANR